MASQKKHFLGERNIFKMNSDSDCEIHYQRGVAGPSTTAQSQGVSNNSRRGYKSYTNPRYNSGCCLDKINPCCCCLNSDKFRRAVIFVAIIGFAVNLASFLVYDAELAQYCSRANNNDNNYYERNFKLLTFVVWIMIFLRCICATADLLLLFRVKKTKGQCVKKVADKFLCPYVFWLCSYGVLWSLQMIHLIHIYLIGRENAIPSSISKPFSIHNQSAPNDTFQQHHNKTNIHCNKTNYPFYSIFTSSAPQSDGDSTLFTIIIYGIIEFGLRCWFILIVLVYLKRRVTSKRSLAMRCYSEGRQQYGIVGQQRLVSGQKVEDSDNDDDDESSDTSESFIYNL